MKPAVLLFVLVGCFAIATANPAVPDGYTCLTNSTALFATGQSVNFLQSYYQGYNSTLVVTYSPGPTSNQLSLGGSQTQVSFNPATKACQPSCVNNQVCSGGKCHVWGQGAFGALPAATANGACTFDVTGGTKYTLTVPASNGATGLAIEYCFVSNQVWQPVYILEKVLSSQPGEMEARRVLREVVPSQQGMSPTEVLILVEKFTPSTPSRETFAVPPFCNSCASRGPSGAGCVSAVETAPTHGETALNGAQKPKRTAHRFATMAKCKGAKCRYKAKIGCPRNMCLACCTKLKGTCAVHEEARKDEDRILKRLAAEALAYGQKKRVRLVDRSRIKEKALKEVGDTAVIFCIHDFLRTPKFSRDTLNAQRRLKRVKQ